MEETEGAVKAPVTRLRRRLSVEQSDDAKSSSAPNTPTKKRNGRRTAKSELDLIDENAPENDTPKTLIKKTMMKELEVEEKPITPTRRSARIKSNSSIVLDTVQAVDSPRAKRATRRNSQVGSDNETQLTPARHTRRTRKDSANADKAETQPAMPIKEVIVEESELLVQTSQSNTEKTNEQNVSQSGLRKSPRLSQIKNKISDSPEINEKENNKSKEFSLNKDRDSLETNKKEIDTPDVHNNSNKENEMTQEKDSSENISPHINLIDICNSISDLENNKHSISNIELLKKLKNEPIKKDKRLNKSCTELVNTQSFKRCRAKSWTALSDSEENNNKCYSDSENSKKAKKSLVSKSYKDDKLNVSTNKKTNSLPNITTKEDIDVISSPNRNKKLLSPPTNSITLTTKLFENPPNSYTQLVYIEESDSNSEKGIHKQITDEDQCVPIVQTYYNSQETLPQEVKNNSFLDFGQKNDSINKNDSCEPMDIDETLPTNITSNKSLLKTLDMSENKVSLEQADTLNISNNRKDKSRQTPDKSANENKNALVLSQIKNVSSSQIETDKMISNANKTLDVTQNNLDKKNTSGNYSTSTPLQQRNLIKHVLQVNTSDIASETCKIDKSSNNSMINVTSTNKSNNSLKSDISIESDSCDESSQSDRNFLEDEAEEASDDYESGDSRNDEEKQYEREHEIIQRGETLTSEDDLSNDSDYEKGSFIVSTDEEDGELLDGSGDDLSMTDNELKMTAKSKKKYNERKIKEQKKASREMFESRHKLNLSNNSTKSELTKRNKKRSVIESSNSEDEDIKVKIKKKNRMRFDSSQEISINDSSLNNSKHQQNKSFSNSVHNKSVTNNELMNIIEDDIENESDPLTIDMKKEPKSSLKQTVNTSSQIIEDSEKNYVDKTNHDVALAENLLDKSCASDSSESSNNEHIQNYDAVLNDLNKNLKAKENKKGDISLNLDKKTKQKSVPIVDQLNLTQIKLKKNKQNAALLAIGEKPLHNKSNKDSDYNSNKHTPKDENALKTSNKYLNNISKKLDLNKESFNVDDNESSASIDLNLLFSEDSSNSEDTEIKDNTDTQNSQDDNFIPLKQSYGKMDILETSRSNDVSHSEKPKKINKKNKDVEKSSLENESDENEVQMFLDTTGTHSSTEVNKSISFSAAKKKKEMHIANEQDESDSDTPMELLNKNVSKAEEQPVEIEEFIDTSLTAAALNKSKTKTPRSDKKKKRISLTITNEQILDSEEIKPDEEFCNEAKGKQGTADKSINKSVSQTPTSDKKKPKRLTESKEQNDEESDSDAPAEVSNKSIVETQTQKVDIKEAGDANLMTLNISKTKTPKSDKKKQRLSESERKHPPESDSDTPMELSNKNVSKAEEQPVEIEEFIDTSLTAAALNKSKTKTPRSDKKKKRISLTITNEQMLDSEEIKPDEEFCNEAKGKQGTADKSINKSVSRTPTSDKKKPKRLTESQEQNDEESDSDAPAEVSNKSIVETQTQKVDMKEAGDASLMTLNISKTKTPKSDKKKQRLSESERKHPPAQEVTPDIDKKLLNSLNKQESNKNVIFEDLTTNKDSSRKMKKTTKITGADDTTNNGSVTESSETANSKKRKRKSSLNQMDQEPESAELVPCVTSKSSTVTVPVSATSQNKKRKISRNVEDSAHLDGASIAKTKVSPVENQQDKQKASSESESKNKGNNTDVNVNTKKESKKRKEREDEGIKMAKVPKIDTTDKSQVPRLPANILQQLDDRPRKKSHEVTKSEAISTTNFVVEKPKIKKPKPSNYLEESIYLNEEEDFQSKTQRRVKNPKVLPFLPTVSTSHSGFTSNFKVSVLPKEIKFVAKSSTAVNYKNDYLQNKKMKRLGTYDLYKRNRTIKMSKF